MPATSIIHLKITFFGKIAGALGVGHQITAERCVEISEPYTAEQLAEAARVALYEKEGDSPAYQSVTIRDLKVLSRVS